MATVGAGPDTDPGPAYGPAPLVRTKSPIIRFEPSTFDWGQVDEGEKYTHTFQVHNDGNSALEIRRIQPSCGCATTSQLDTIPPGESRPLELSIDTKKLRGRIEKFATIYSNDPATTKAKISLGGIVRVIVATEPELFEFSTRAGESIDVDLAFYAGTERKFTIEKLETRFGNVTFGELVLGEDGRYRVKGTTKKLNRSVTKKETLKLKLRMEDTGKVARVEIPFDLEHRDVVSFEPGRRVQLPRQETQTLRETGEAIERVVTIRPTADGGPFTIQKIERRRLPDEVEASILAKEDGSYEVTVHFNGVPSAQLVTGQFVLHTDLAIQPQRVIQVIAHFPRGG